MTQHVPEDDTPMSSASHQQQQPRLRAPRRRRGATESLLSVVLGLEMMLVFFVALVFYGLRKLEPLQALFGGILVVVLLVIATRMLRYTWGPWLGAALQLIFIACGFLEPIMFLIGVGFAAMYGYYFAKGRQLDRRNERFRARLESERADAETEGE